MPIQHHRRPVFYFSAFALLIITLFLNGATAQTGGDESQMRELDEKLRDPRFLLLRAGAFDPLESEPAAVRVGQRSWKPPAWLRAQPGWLPARGRRPRTSLSTSSFSTQIISCRRK